MNLLGLAVRKHLPPLPFVHVNVNTLLGITTGSMNVKMVTTMPLMVASIARLREGGNVKMAALGTLTLVLNFEVTASTMENMNAMTETI